MPASRTTVEVAECADIDVVAFATNSRWPFVDVRLDGHVVIKLTSVDDIDRLDVALDRAREYFTHRPTTMTAVAS